MIASCSPFEKSAHAAAQGRNGDKETFSVFVASLRRRVKIVFRALDVILAHRTNGIDSPVWVAGGGR